MQVFNFYTNDAPVEKTEEEIYDFFGIEPENKLDAFFHNPLGWMAYTDNYTEEQMRVIHSRFYGLYVVTDLTKKETYMISDFLRILEIPDMTINEQELRDHFIQGFLNNGNFLIYREGSLDEDSGPYILSLRQLNGMDDYCDPPILTFLYPAKIKDNIGLNELNVDSIFTPEKIEKMYRCRHLLPQPGDIVVKECLDEIIRLRQSLTDIVYPIDKMKREAKKEGNKLNGQMAIRIADDSYYLRKEAANALGIQI